MKFKVDLEADINMMLKNNIALSKYFSKNSSTFFERYWDKGYMFSDPYCHKHFHRFLSKGNFTYLRKLLKDEKSFENPLFYLLFKAFVYAEIKFVNNFIPQNSHEERLTGHLVSEIANSLSIVSATFKKQAFDLYQTEVDLNFNYADLSSNNQEKNTGADLGFIFHINLPDYKEKVNVLIIQAKKFNNTATIDMKQIEILKTFAEESAYYCFYDMNKNDLTSPLIQSANNITSLLGNNEEGYSTKTLSRDKIINHYKSGIPLSLFLIFEMLNPYSNSVKSFSNIWQAKNFIDDRNKDYNISKVLTVSVGGFKNSNQDLRDINQLFSFEEYGDD